MGRPEKMLSEFDARLGAVVKSRRTKAGMSLEAFAQATGIPTSNVQRRESGRNAITVSELERIVLALNEILPTPTTSRAIVAEALADYGGLAKLRAEHVAVSDGASNVTSHDNVTYLGRYHPPESVAADENPPTPPME